MKVVLREDESEGLPKFLGKSVVLYCMNYIYTGTLVGINNSCIKLDPAYIVYETGELCASSWKDAQKLPGAHYVANGCIESFGPGKS